MWENSGVSEMWIEPIVKAPHHTSLLFRMRWFGLFFYCSFAIASFLIFWELWAAVHWSWRSGQICSGSLCFPEGIQQNQKPSCYLMCKFCSGLMYYTQLWEELSFRRMTLYIYSFYNIFTIYLLIFQSVSLALMLTAFMTIFCLTRDTFLLPLSKKQEFGQMAWRYKR